MVVVSGSRVRKVTAYPLAGTPSISPTPPEMFARGVLTSRPNSHPFQERTLVLNPLAKVGRSVARARAASNNAIFDCKVLSRHHALLWYEDGKFFLQDTKSSNGTFVNNNRLSESAAESEPREVSSGDIVQFGVDVVENNRRVTHGCIIATLKLYLPDGKEAKASQSVGAGTIGTGGGDDLLLLAQYLREALRREHQLETKLVALQRLVEQARQAAELGWRAAVDEDRLLSRVAVLENQLRAYSKTCGDDSLREELQRLQEDKQSYQVAAKDSLQRLHKERLEALDKVTVLERAAASADEDRSAALEQCVKAQEELRQLAIQLLDSQRQTRELAKKLTETELEDADLRSKLTDLTEQERVLNLRIDTVESFALNPSMLAVLKSELSRAQEEVEANEIKILDKIDDIQEIQKDDETRKTCQKLQEQIEILEKILPPSVVTKTMEQDNESPSIILNVQDQLVTLEQQIKDEIETKEMLVKENNSLKQKLVDAEQLAKESKNEAQQLRDKVKVVIADLEARPSQTEIDDNLGLIRQSQELIKNLESENSRLENELTRISAGVCADNNGWVEIARVSELEDELVLIKEKHAQCVPDRTKLENDLQAAVSQVQKLSTRSQTVLFCYIAPLVLAIVYLLLRSAFA